MFHILSVVSCRTSSTYKYILKWWNNVGDSTVLTSWVEEQGLGSILWVTQFDTLYPQVSHPQYSCSLRPDSMPLDSSLSDRIIFPWSRSGNGHCWMWWDGQGNLPFSKWKSSPEKTYYRVFVPSDSPLLESTAVQPLPGLILHFSCSKRG